MNFYSDKESQVFAYDDEQLSLVSRLSELEFLIQEKELSAISAKNNVEQITLELDEAKALLESITANVINSDDDNATEINKEIQRVKLLIDSKAILQNEAIALLNETETEYFTLKGEYDDFSPAFFAIREKLKVLNKMTKKEVEAHLNPPITKKQLVSEAEQQKQSLLSEATDAIAPLQDAVDIDIANDEEIILLKEWKKYRVLLNRVDISLAPDIDWPQKP